MQSQRFVEAARAAGCDEAETHFAERLKKVATAKGGGETGAKRPKKVRGGG